MRAVKCVGAVATAALGAVVYLPAEPSAREAQTFLATLSADQKKVAVLPPGSKGLTDWHFIPRSRTGICWADLSPDQRKAAHALLRSSLSKAGYEKVETIRNLELVIREMEGNNLSRDPERYYFLFFGEPSENHPWAWRYEGHHVSLTFAYRDGRLVASTPQFLGSNPAELLSGPKKGDRVLAKEQDLAFQFAASLTPDQLAKAKVGTEAPAEIVTGVARRAVIEGRRGVRYADLSAAQRKTLIDLLKVHSSVQSDAEQARRLQALQKEDLNDLVFAWMGPVERKGRHYYRIQGENILVEYDNTQTDGNHIHTVWRNLKEDFGGDPLLAHYETDHAGTESKP